MRACLRPTADDLNGRVARGAAWMVTLVVVRTILTLGATAILARLLTPADYGYVAMATVVTEFGAMLCVFGLPAIIVREQHLRRLDLDSGFWFSVALGVTIAGAIVAASSLIADLFHEPRLDAHPVGDVEHRSSSRSSPRSTSRSPIGCCSSATSSSASSRACWCASR